MVEVNVPFDVAAQGGFSGFQETGMVEGFFGFVTFDSGIFLGRNIWQVFFGGGLIQEGIFWGIQNNLISISQLHSFANKVQSNFSCNIIYFFL